MLLMLAFTSLYHMNTTELVNKGQKTLCKYNGYLLSHRLELSKLMPITAKFLTIENNENLT